MRGLTLVVLTGAALALGAPLGWQLSQGGAPDGFGAAAARTAAGAAPGTGGGPPADALPAVRSSSALLTDVVAPADPPVELLLGGVRVPVDAVGLDASAQVVVPDDVRRAGWYAAGAQPGDPSGSAVLVGHVDDRDHGVGAFAVLRELTAGAEVRVRTATGELAYEVVAREQFDKAEVPVQRLFAPSGPHRLVLVTCDGDFDRARSSYSDNVVVTAVLRP